MSRSRRSSAALGVSDHAALRWLQRSGLVDLEPIKQALAIALDRPFRAAATIGGGEFLILRDGLVFLVRDETLVTVLNDDGRHNHARRFRQLAGPIAEGPIAEGPGDA